MVLYITRHVYIQQAVKPPQIGVPFALLVPFEILQHFKFNKCFFILVFVQIDLGLY